MKKFNQFTAESNTCPICNSEPCTCPGGDNHITESDAAWAAAETKRKEQEAKKALTKKDASTVDKIRAMMAKEKMKEEVDESLKPGWMLKADPKLAAAVKAKQDINKKREASYGKPSAGTSVPRTPKNEYDRKVDSYLNKKYNKEEVEIEEANTPSDSDLHKTLGSTKNMQQGVEALKKKHGMSDDEAKKHIRRLMGMKEEVEQIDELSKRTLRSYIDKKSDDHESNRQAVIDARDSLRQHQRNKPSLDAPLKHQFDHDEKKRKLEKDVNAASRIATRSNINILKAKKRLNKEEVTMNEAKDEQEYGYEGAMAMTQLKTLTRHAEHMMGMMKEDTDLPEWVQSKITLATDYVQTAHDYLMSEMNEEVEENYVSHAQRKAVWAARNDEKMKKEDMHTDKKEDPPFDGPYSKKKVATPGKQGYGMSAARHLARQALQKVVDKQKNK